MRTHRSLRKNRTSPRDTLCRNISQATALPRAPNRRFPTILVIQKVVEYGAVLPLPFYVLIVTFDRVHKSFMQALYDSHISLENVIIIQNNNDILNLIEIISRVSCLISPSTGPIHVASHLRILTIGLFSHKDTIKWAIWDKQYVLINRKANQLSTQEKGNIINETLKILHNNISNQHIFPIDREKLITI